MHVVIKPFHTEYKWKFIPVMKRTLLTSECMLREHVKIRITYSWKEKN